MLIYYVDLCDSMVSLIYSLELINSIPLQYKCDIGLLSIIGLLIIDIIIIDVTLVSLSRLQIDVSRCILMELITLTQIR
jgi:hypothetical protein